MKRMQILTLFPELIEPYTRGSILGKAIKAKLLKVEFFNWRKYATNRQQHVDDKPYGGGAGMLLQVEPIYKQLKALKLLKHDKKTRVVMLSPDGKKFDQARAKIWAKKYDRLVLVCGRYEGFDKRVEKFVDEKISIGNYVLAGGELAALVVVEAVARNFSGVVGHEQALQDETFSHGADYGEYAQYTRPAVFVAAGKKMAVPKILLSGDHKKIAAWKVKNQKKI